ncbi:hypothetical protein BHE74_00019514, partial [Ensete ventricosum]
ALALLHPHCAAAAATHAQATAALSGKQLPCQGAATPATDTVTLAGGRAGRCRMALAGWPLVSAPAG